ncbi:unnamed protein product, partial [marine sediment metagenome]
MHIGSQHGQTSVDSFAGLGVDIKIDPTFGYSGTGAQEGTCANYMNAYEPATAPASDGTADNITVYLSGWGAGEEVKCALYDNTDDSKIAETAERTTGGDSGWFVFVFSEPKPSITNGGDYLLVCFGDDTVNNNFDTTGSGTVYREAA